MIWNKVIAFLSMGRLALLPLAGFAEALSIYRRKICNERHDLPLISNGIPLLSPAKLQIILQGDCRTTRRTDGKRRITWPERLLLDLKAGKSVDKTDGNPEMAAVAQSLGRPNVDHKVFPIFLPSHHATTEGPLTLSPAISLYAPLLLRNLRAFRMP